jgi:ribosomal protein L17
MSDKKKEVGKLLIAAAFDASLRKLNAELASRDIVITSKTITTVIQISMEIVEATSLKGEEQKKLVEKLVTKSVKDAPITEEKRKLLLSMIEEGIVGDVIDLVVSATKGELDVNAIEKVAVGCCLSVLKSRQRTGNNKI